jgi:hypothetical protein
MRDYIKQFEETIEYLTKNSEYYTKLFPEGVRLRTPSEVLDKLKKEDKLFRKEIGFWLWRLFDGYRKFVGSEVWREMPTKDFFVFSRIIGLLFPSVKGEKLIYKVLTEHPQRLHADELVWISEYIIKHKDKVLSCDKAEPPTAKLFYHLELPNNGTGGTNTIIAVRKFAFDPMAILLHAYVYRVLLFIAPLLLSKKRKRRKKA